MVKIEKEINGATYKTVQAAELGSCEGCVFEFDGDGCENSGSQCVVSGDIVWAKKED